MFGDRIFYEPEKVTVKGKEFTIEQLSGRGSTARVSITGEKIRITLPRYASRRESMRIYSEFKDWALKRLEKIDHTTLEPKPKLIPFVDGQELTVIGEKARLIITEGGSSSAAKSDGETITIRLREGLKGEEKKRETHLLVRKAITRASSEHLKNHVQGLNGRHFDFKLNGISIRDQSSRWASCSRRSRKISLNFRILLAPPEIMDYIIIHELAHLKEPNHSKNFWRLVESAVPDYKERRRWLNKNGRTLGMPIEPALQQAPDLQQPLALTESQLEA